MSEELIKNEGELLPEGEPFPKGDFPDGESLPAEDKKRGFKSVCLRLGLMMIVVFVSRAAASVVLSLLAPAFEGLDITLAYLLDTLFSFVFLYVIPITAAWFIMKPSRGMTREIYKKPVYFGHALGMFPAIYGIGIAINLVTILVSQFFVNTDLNKSFNTVNELSPENIPCALILVFQLVVIAPIFEELWFRGIVMESLRPYGNGFAIFISALLFGLTHGNLQQVFYATALGICLGYIAVSTRSIVTTTVMHAMFNSISAIIMVFYATPSVQEFMGSMGDDGTDDPVVMAFMAFIFLVLMLLIVGVFMAIWKLRKIKKYRVEKVWTEVSAARRWGIFLSRFTVIIMLILAADTLTFRFIPTFAYRLITGQL